MAACAARTQSANGPPPGTRMSGPPQAASASSQAAQCGVCARLPPSLTIVTRDVFSLRGIARESRHARTGGGLFRRAFALDLNTDRAAHDVEFFYPHANPRDAGITQDFIREAAWQRLDQIDMASPEDDFDRVDNDIVGENAAHVVKPTVVALHIRVDVEADVLGMTALEIIGADRAGEHKIMHENQIRLDKALIGRDIAAPQMETPIDPRIISRARSIRLARNEIPDHPDRCGVDFALAHAAVAQTAAKAEIIRLQRQQARHVGRFERAGEARHEPILPAMADETIERGDVHMIEKTAGSFLGGIEHGAGKTIVGHELQKTQIWRAIGEKHPDKLGGLGL